MAAAAVVASSLFAALDEDGDGKVSVSELRCGGCMAAARLSEEEAASIVAAVDSDGDGLLDREEFLNLVARAAAQREEGDDNDVDCLREAFAVYAAAAEGGGGGGEAECIITPASLGRALSRLGWWPRGERELGVEECRAMICRFDLDGDGVLSFDEFRIMMHDGLM